MATSSLSAALQQAAETVAAALVQPAAGHAHVHTMQLNGLVHVKRVSPCCRITMKAVP